MEELSLKVKQKRGGMGIRAAAKEIGISPATLSRIETGKQPDLRSFKLLCEWLNIDPSTALGVRTKVGAPSSQVAPIQAPDMEKIAELAKKIAAIEMPEVTSDKAKEVLDQVGRMLKVVQDHIKTALEESEVGNDTN